MIEGSWLQRQRINAATGHHLQAFSRQPSPFPSPSHRFALGRTAVSSQLVAVLSQPLISVK